MMPLEMAIARIEESNQEDDICSLGNLFNAGKVPLSSNL